MKKRLILTVLVLVLAAAACACSGGNGIWGIYTNETNGEKTSFEFAYSKIIYIDDLDAYDEKAERNDSLFEGWYSEEGGTVKATFSKTAGDAKIKISVVFGYDREKDELVVNEFKKEIDGNAEEDRMSGRLYTKG